MSSRALATREPAGLLRESVKLHLALYGSVNVPLIGIWAASASSSFWPVWPILGWGIAVACHAAPLLARVGSRPPRTGTQTRVKPPRMRAVEVPIGEAATTGGEAGSLRSSTAPDGTLTMLFSDIEASTALNERIGDVRWLELLRVHHAIVRAAVREHGGYEVKAQGDGFIIAFASARRAVQCARAIQSAIDGRLGEHPDGPVRLRIGLHTGEAIKEEADFYGKNVALAARITDQARGGEILASSVVKQLTESAGDVDFDQERQVELDGLAGTYTVYRVT